MSWKHPPPPPPPSTYVCVTCQFGNIPSKCRVYECRVMSAALHHDHDVTRLVLCRAGCGGAWRGAALPATIFDVQKWRHVPVTGAVSDRDPAKVDGQKLETGRGMRGRCALRGRRDGAGKRRRLRRKTLPAWSARISPLNPEQKISATKRRE